MANIITGKVWSLDTTTAFSSAGIVTTNPVYIDKIRVRFTTAGAGSFILKDCPSTFNYTSTMTILDLKTTAATSAAVYTLDYEFSLGYQCFQGLMKTVCVNVDTIYIITCNPR